MSRIPFGPHFAPHSTLGSVALRVHTRVCAHRLSHRAGEPTASHGARLTGCALIATHPAVRVVGAQIAAHPVAHGEVLRAHQTTASHGARLSIGAAIAACSAVGGVCLSAGAAAVAQLASVTTRRGWDIDDNTGVDNDSGICDGDIATDIRSITHNRGRACEQ